MQFLWLIISQGIMALSLIGWLFIAGLSFMVFDAPGSEKNRKLWAFVFTIWSYPILPIGCAIFAWIYWSRGEVTSAMIATSIPLILAIPLAMYFVFVGVLNRN